MDRSEWRCEAPLGTFTSTLTGSSARRRSNSFVVESFLELAAIPTGTHLFRVVRAERFARQRLEALARVDAGVGGDAPAVVFLCVHNAGRSQMALGWFSNLAGDRAAAWSGGSDPISQVHAAVAAAMAEVGIDLSAEFPKPWTNEVLRAADVVVTMGCGDACPLLAGKHYEDWEIEDPAERSVEEVRLIRDEIERRVEQLLDRLGLGVALPSSGYGET